jgi:hypothetical protein
VFFIGLFAVYMIKMLVLFLLEYICLEPELYFSKAYFLNFYFRFKRLISFAPICLKFDNALICFYRPAPCRRPPPTETLIPRPSSSEPEPPQLA